MANPQIVTKQLTAAVADCVCLSQTPTSGTALTINGSLATGGVATLTTQRRIVLAYGNEVSARTLVLRGTSGDGIAISETLAIPAGAPGTVASQLDYLTVTAATPAGGGWSAAVTLGTNTTGSSPWKNVDTARTQVNLSLVGILNSGAATWQIDYTYDDPNGYPITLPLSSPIPNVFPHAVLQGQTGNADSTINDPVWGWRLTITAGTGSVTATGIQGGLVS